MHAVKLWLGGALVASLSFVAPAFAGNLIITGHDVDHHCAGANTGNPGQCHYLQVVVGRIRSGAPDPAKPVLVLDRGNLEVGAALDKASGAGTVPRVVIDPRSPEFAAAPITTDRYSALIVASDSTCGGCDLNEFDTTPDSDAIAARAPAIAAFYNAGGGILALAGGDHGDGAQPTDTYYRFIPVTVGGVAVSPPFTLTPPGKALGLTDGSGGTADDINCCPTHNSFAPPAAGAALEVAEQDGKGQAETLISQGTIGASGFVTAPAPSASSVIKLPDARRCVSRRNFRIRLRQPGRVRLRSATVVVNRRQVKVLRGARLTAPVDLRGLPKGRFTVAINVTTTTGRIVSSTRRYRTCVSNRRR